MFGIRKLREEVASLRELVRELATTRTPVKGDPLDTLAKVLASLADSHAKSQQTSATLLDGLLEKAAKQVIRREGQQNGAKGALLAKMKAREIELPDFVAACEECKAVLAQRPPEHANDMLRHTAEHHVDQLKIAMFPKRGNRNGKPAEEPD